MVLGFKQQFKEPILSGTKIHTIREDKNDRWHAGCIAHMATGVRTKQYEQFAKMEIVSTQDIFMTYGWCLEISIDGKYVYGHVQRVQIAQNDGFENYKYFEDWFYKVIKESKDDCFSGKLIHWTNHRY